MCTYTYLEREREVVCKCHQAKSYSGELQGSKFT